MLSICASDLYTWKNLMLCESFYGRLGFEFQSLLIFAKFEKYELKYLQVISGTDLWPLQEIIRIVSDPSKFEVVQC